MKYASGRHIAVVLVTLILVASTGFGALFGGLGKASAAGPYTTYLPFIVKDWMQVDPAAHFGIWTGGGSAPVVTAARNAGAGYALVTMSWATVQPASDATLDFSAYDAAIARIRAADMSPIVQVRENPAWASEDFGANCGPIDAADQAAYTAFLQAAVDRYKDQVNLWEFYNEPDNRDKAQGEFYGGCWGDNPAQYAQLLQQAATVLRADPTYSLKARVIFGGLAYERDPGNPTRINQNFLDQVMDQGGAAYFDVANVHYLSTFETTPTWDPGSDGWGSIVNKVQAIRNILSSNGYGSRHVMVSEVSWTNTTNDEDQANYVAKVLARGLSSAATPILWFSLNWDHDAEYGLTNPNLSPRPAYFAYRAAAREFGGAQFIVRPVYPADVGVADGVDGYVFGVDGRERWVLWATGGVKNILVPAGAQQVYDRSGTFVTLPGNRAYTLTASPIFLRY